MPDHRRRLLAELVRALGDLGDAVEAIVGAETHEERHGEPCDALPEASPAWAAFVAEHDLAAETRAAMRSDDAVLGVTLRLFEEFGCGAFTADVADALGLSARTVLRVLHRLADAAKILRLRPRDGHGSLGWWPIGVPLTAAAARFYVVG